MFLSMAADLWALVFQLGKIANTVHQPFQVLNKIPKKKKKLYRGDNRVGDVLSYDIRIIWAEEFKFGLGESNSNVI